MNLNNDFKNLIKEIHEQLKDSDNVNVNLLNELLDLTEREISARGQEQEWDDNGCYWNDSGCEF